MRIVVIGGTGHIGTYLVPRLVMEGHEVVSLSRGRRKPYRDPGIWRFVEQITMDRREEESAGSFGGRIAELAADVVIDLICFREESARALVDRLFGKVGQYLCCGTISVHGPSKVVPTAEAMPRTPVGEYGIRKAALEAWLLAQAHRTGFPATVLHPGHISGPGWIPLNPAANFDTGVFRALAEGRKVVLPNRGMETVHHVHADDVAQAFCRAIEHRGVSIGESFHVASEAAMTLRGYAERMARWFGRAAELDYLPLEEWKQLAAPQDASVTADILLQSPCCSIAKARRLIGYEPRYTSLEAICESVDWLVEHGWQA
jgi:nucleoside-diphosphate-sugar epimerase